MTVLGSLLGSRRSLENPAKPLTDLSLREYLGGGPTEAGVNVTAESALGLTAVYRAHALIAGLLGALPMHSYRRRSDGGREPAPAGVIDNPNPDMTSMELWEYVGLSLLGHGNGYVYKRRDRALRVRELEPFRPDTMRVERKKDWRSDTNPSGKRFTESTTAGEKVYTPFDVLHIPGLSYDGTKGMSPIGVARQSLGRSMAAERFGARMFGHGALIQGILTADGEITEDTAKRFKAQWRERTTGPERNWDIPVLHSGAKFQPIALPPADAQFIETMKFGVQDVARLYGLPPHLLGDVERSTSWGTGIEQQATQMLVYMLDAWLTRIEQRVTREVVADSTQYVKYNRAALLRADTATRFMAYQRAINNGWMNADEIRQLEERDPLPDGLGQIFYQPKNLSPVSADGAAVDTGATNGG